jgi:hypothetical protein
MLCLGKHSNVMHRFKVQALQDPPLCSSTWNTWGAWGTLIHEKKLRSKISCQTPFNKKTHGLTLKNKKCNLLGKM